MDSPLFPITSNIFMDHFKSKTIETYNLKPIVWFRYVDDTFVVWRHGREKLDKFLSHLNGQHRYIVFTIELEESGFTSLCSMSKYRDQTLSWNSSSTESLHILVGTSITPLTITL